MKPWTKRLSVFAGVIVAASLAAGGWYLAKALPVGTGYVAKYLCSSTFISGRDDKTVFREDVSPINPIARVVSYRVDRQGKSVSADVFGMFESVAIYREGCGCTLIRGVRPEELNRQPIAVPLARRTLSQDLPWPLGNQGELEPVPSAVDRAKLEGALDRAFAEESPEKPKKTRAVLVVYDGRLIAERYAPGIDRDMPLLGWSMAKSITSALVGILVKKGKLTLDAPAPVPEWRQKGDPRGRITLDQLLRMSSGLEFDEAYAPLHDATDMLYGSEDFAAYAASKPLETDPGGTWNYSSGTANIIARIVRSAAEKEASNYYRFLRDELFDRIGMTSAVFEPDPSGTFVGSSYAFATARDWARFGLLFLRDGVWEGSPILPEGWVKYSTTPTPKAPKGEYGALFWLNAGPDSNPRARRWPLVPRDAYSAEGFQYQRVIIIPSRKLILVRFGATSGQGSWNSQSFIQDVLSAFSAL
jgi:CubicO group peptidase (beta-lactamase class C family)